MVQAVEHRTKRTPSTVFNGTSEPGLTYAARFARGQEAVALCNETLSSDVMSDGLGPSRGDGGADASELVLDRGAERRNGNDAGE